MIELLTAEQVRILGALVEKEITTPDYYPLTLKAVVAACNQKSNRDPVMALTESAVERELFQLMDRQLAWRVTGSGSRVPKYEQNITQKWELDRQETAIICELMLRGHQTLGELKNRGHRLFPFYKLIQVETAIGRLLEKDMVAELPRQVGQKENRFAHLLCGEPDVQQEPELATRLQQPPSTHSDEVTRLEQRVEQMEQELAALRDAFEKFKRQFE